MTTLEKQDHSDVSSSVLFKGSCACGRISYECTSTPSAVQSCHCVTCRKLSGGPYQSFADVENQGVTFYDNKEHLRYEGLPKDDIGGITFLRFSQLGERAFCAQCHSPLAMRYKHSPDLVGPTLGTVDEDSINKNGHIKDALRPQGHIFTSQKAWWVDVERDGLPMHARFTGDFEQDMKAWQGKEG